MLGDLIGSEHRQECLKCEACKFGSEQTGRNRRNQAIALIDRSAAPNSAHLQGRRAATQASAVIAALEVLRHRKSKGGTAPDASG
jgi:hypothetical protein